ncbi:MAG TPA: magnesium transporter CorA family protein [Clostridiaceae bacterium]|nr:magnesium transporter CorA family protein [Clostridia bacterium]CDC06674.1 mg2 transporter protein CorA family protein [Clostridium sp. CAG:343]HCF34875.1 magnesium transporter CorA family protein [Clostridiales bacterium]HJJ17835.1 magnesium transporter CorA family protein [Clostridiaceae bacterium]MBP8633610.1 magnesium transporter CorA family protein [Clostridia bacterium]
MLKIYNTDIETNEFQEIREFKKGSWINLVNPSENEIKKVCENINIQEDFIRDALDYEEKARIDKEEDDNTILFVVDVPISEKGEENEIYTTMPLGMIVVRDEFFLTVSLRKNKIIESFEKRKIKNFQTYKKTRFIFQILYLNSSYYLNYLKQINKETEIAEYILKNSMQNKELLKLLSLEKSLVYFTTSLKSNEIVMEKTLRGKIVKLYEEDEEILEDAITENRQAIEMAQIYSNILNGTMDAYASIISNNLNGVMKFLTSITIILAVPTMISSFWGMNVKLPFENSPMGFLIMVLIAIIMTIAVTLWLNKKDMLK